MNPVITEQLNKFKAGDFSGYEGFYNETVNTVYTMLHTIVNDQNVATSLVAQVYDKIYQNATSLEQTEGFYQWTAGVANEEALEYLKEHNLAGAISAAPKSGKAPTEQFCDYAVGDEELMVTEAVVEDNAFVTKLQDIVGTLTPIERIIFQDYYYFGIGVPEIAAKTGCKDADIRYALSRTRTSIVQAITASPAYAADYGNPNVRRYRLAEAPWMWIAYQNFLGYTLGIDTVSIAGWSLGVLGQAAGSGIAIGTGAEGMIAGGASGAGVEGTAGTMAGAGAQGTAGAMAGAGAAGAAAGASGASGIAAGILGTIGGKIALGVIGAALVTGIGFGVHHVMTERQATTEVVTTTEAASETASETTTEATTEAASETTTEVTTEATTEEVIDYSLYENYLLTRQQEIQEQFKDFDENSPQAEYSNPQYFQYCQMDFDSDGTDELIIGEYENVEFGATFVQSIYTIENGKLTKVFDSTDYDEYQYGSRYILYEGGYICTAIADFSTGGICFRYKDGQCLYEDGFFTFTYEDGSSRCYLSNNEDAFKEYHEKRQAENPNDIMNWITENPEEFQTLNSKSDWNSKYTYLELSWNSIVD